MIDARLKSAAGLLAGLTAMLGASGSQARPYLMLAADNTGFIALDLGAIGQKDIDTAQVTMISAPLAGARYGDKIAAVKKERIEFECQGERWRLVGVSYADAKDQTLAADPTAASDWQPIAGKPLLPVARDAGCLRRYRQAMVSRDLNLGDIVSNFHKAWSPPAAQPLTEKQLLEQRFKANH